ncbi:hypothetical protein PRZ48_002307 [Zasmidium cellare]|uniref:Uncharacterized protein n=1 Tax=Zasmidium cellare TaxID=395010 RepID=A0ABR0F6K7_ZASCE|nr:hypothetical protein PRZ48_002307 [Zasmidium cellare]
MSCRSLIDFLTSPFTRNGQQAARPDQSQPASSSRDASDPYNHAATASEEELNRRQETAKKTSLSQLQQPHQPEPGPEPGPEPVTEPATWTERLFGSLRSAWNTLARSNETGRSGSTGDAAAAHRPTGIAARVADTDGAVEMQRPQRPARPQQPRGSMPSGWKDVLRSDQEQRKAERAAAQAPSTGEDTSEMQPPLAGRGDSCTSAQVVRSGDDDNKAVDTAMMSAAITEEHNQGSATDGQESGPEPPNTTENHANNADNTASSSSTPAAQPETSEHQNDTSEPASIAEPSESTNGQDDDNADKTPETSTDPGALLEASNGSSSTGQPESAPRKHSLWTGHACGCGLSFAHTADCPLDSQGVRVQNVDEMRWSSPGMAGTPTDHDSYRKSKPGSNFIWNGHQPVQGAVAQGPSSSTQNDAVASGSSAPNDADTSAAANDAHPPSCNDVDAPAGNAATNSAATGAGGPAENIASASKANDAGPSVEREGHDANNDGDTPEVANATPAQSSNVYEQTFQVNMVREIVYDNDPFIRFPRPSGDRPSQSLRDERADSGATAEDLTGAA